MLYPIVKTLVRVYYAIFFRVTVIGEENIPKEGSAVLCSNHISNYDPLTLAAYLKRLPRFMAKKELFKNRALGWLITNLNAFPVDRSIADMSAFKNAVKILKSGEMIGIFAQGTRVKEGDEKAAKAGVALFAVKGDAPVIPIAISGSYKPFSKLVINYGKPIELEEYRGKRVNTETLGEITEMIMEKVNELKVEV